MDKKKACLFAGIGGVLAIIAIVLIVVFTIPRAKTISFMVDGEAYITMKSKGKEEIELPKDPTKEGFTFEGWFSDEAYTTAFTKDTLLDTKLKEDMCVYAYFLEKNGVEGVDVLLNGFKSSTIDGVGEALAMVVGHDTATFNFKNIIKVSPKATYTFSSDKAGSNKLTNDTLNLNDGKNVCYLNITDRHGNTKCYTIVVSKKKLVTITFDVKGGEAIDSVSLEEGSKLGEVPTPVKEGYTFKAWDYDFNNPITEDITVNASYDNNKYTVTLNYGYDVAKKELSATFDKELLLETPTRKGYTFDGWYKEDDKKLESGDYKIPSDIELTAKWTADSHTIEYDLGDEAAVNPEDNPVKYTIEDTVTIKNPTLENYNFLGWTYEGVTEPVKDLTIDSSKLLDYKLVANWAGKDITITVHYYEVGLVDKTFTVDTNYGAHLDKIDVKPLEGYTFAGYYKDKEFKSSYTYSDGTLPTWSKVKEDGDFELYAQYEHEITLHLNGGRGSEFVTLELGKTISERFTPERDNDVFEGWYIDKFYKTKATAENLKKATDAYAKFVGDISPENFEYTVSGRFTQVTKIKSATPVFNIPNYLDDHKVMIMPGAFLECGSVITELNIGKDVSLENEGSLKGITNLVTLTTSGIGNMTDSNTKPLGFLFGQDEAGVIQNDVKYYIPATLRTVNLLASGLGFRSMFENCTNIVEINLKDTGSDIDVPMNTFKNCKSLERFNANSKYDVVLWDTLESIEDYAFFGCESIKSMYIPENNSIGITLYDKALFGLASLSRINFEQDGEAIISIDTAVSGSFGRMPKITRLKINNDFANIEGMILDVPNLTELELPYLANGRQETAKVADIFFSDLHGHGGLQSSGTLEVDYQIYYVPENLRKIILNDQAIVGESMLEGMDNVEELEMPNLRDVKARAFYNCKNLSKINAYGGQYGYFLPNEMHTLETDVFVNNLSCYTIKADGLSLNEADLIVNMPFLYKINDVELNRDLNADGLRNKAIARAKEIRDSIHNPNPNLDDKLALTQMSIANEERLEYITNDLEALKHFCRGYIIQKK